MKKHQRYVTYVAPVMRSIEGHPVRPLCLSGESEYYDEDEVSFWYEKRR